MNLELLKDKFWREKLEKSYGVHFWGQQNPKLCSEKLVLQEPIKTLQQIIEFDNDFHKFVRRRQFLTFSVLEVC